MLVHEREAKICKKRVTKEYEAIKANPLPNVQCSLTGCLESASGPLNWYCMLTDLGNEFEGGEYLFHIKLSARYPFEPPDFLFLTPVSTAHKRQETRDKRQETRDKRQDSILARS